MDGVVWAAFTSKIILQTAKPFAVLYLFFLRPRVCSGPCKMAGRSAVIRLCHLRQLLSAPLSTGWRYRCSECGDLGVRRSRGKKEGPKNRPTKAAAGFEPAHQGFAGPCLTTWLRRRPSKSGRRDLNPRPPPWQGGALPTELRPLAPPIVPGPGGLVNENDSLKRER